MKNLLLLTSFLLLLTNNFYSATITSLSTGNWSSPATWVGGVVPSTGDAVIIAGGHTITADINTTCSSITLNTSTGFSATALTINNGISLTISNNLILKAGGLLGAFLTLNGNATLNVGGGITFSGSAAFVQSQINMTGGASTINVSGNITLSSGTEDLKSSTTSTINFNGTTSQTIPLPPTFKYNNLILNNSSVGGAVLGAAITTTNLTGNITVQSGRFSNGGFAIAGNSGKTFKVASGAKFEMKGTTGLPSTFTHIITNGSTIEYAGLTQTIEVPNNAQDYFNLTISGSGIKSLSTGGNRNVKGTLSVLTGATLALGSGADTLTLVSNSVGTARLATVTGSITGTNLNVQRYVGLTATNWRFLSSPCSAQTLANWGDDFETSGFLGSTAPSYSFNSIYTYDETVTGIQDSGYIGATNITNPINVGEGYWAYLGPTPLTIDIVGAPNTGNISLPVTYTPSAGANDDGWNMVGNPYASSIDWTNVTKTGLEDLYYIFDPSSGNFATWNETSSLGTLGANGNIGSSQGFWVHAISSPTLSVTELSKTGNVAGTFFKQSSQSDYLLLSLSSSINSYHDETIIQSNINANNNYESYDAEKMFTTVPSAPSLSSISSDNKDLSINSISQLQVNDSITIPIRVKVGITGSYTIKANVLNNFISNSNVVLEDLLTGVITDFNIDSTYTFSISDTTNSPRFLLHITSYMATNVSLSPLKNTTNDVVVYPNPFKTSTTIEINTIKLPASFVLYDQLGKKVKQIQLTKSHFSILRGNLNEGLYFYNIRSKDNKLFRGKLIIE